MREQPEAAAKIIQLNKTVNAQFELLNKELTQGKFLRKPASNDEMTISKEIASLVSASKDTSSKYFQFGDIRIARPYALLFIGILFFGVMLLSRNAQKEDLERQRDDSVNLKNRSLLMDTILASLSEALIVIDKDGNFTHYNASAQRIIGTKIKNVFTEFSIRNIGFFDITSGNPLHKEDLPFYRALLGEEIDEQEVYVKNETQPDGMFISLSSRYISDIDGSISGALVV